MSEVIGADSRDGIGRKESKVLETKFPAKEDLPGVLGLDPDDATGLHWGQGEGGEGMARPTLDG